LSRGSESLSRAPLFAELSSQDVRALDSRCIWRKVNAGAWVIDDHADGMDVFFVLGGHARVVIGGSAREIILRDIFDGEFFGELSAIDGRPRSAGIVAITDTVVAQMPSKVFREVIHHHPSVCDQVLATLAAAIRALNERVNEQVNLDAHDRLCVELLRLSRKSGEGRIVVSPPPTHAELAARIGAHREAVTKFLSALQREGAISRTRSAIVLTNPERLRAIAARLG
jgi:CRP/FNR family transcriptional regulator, cyclic AMP receptor protein